MFVCDEEVADEIKRLEIKNKQLADNLSFVAELWERGSDPKEYKGSIKRAKTAPMELGE